VAANRTQREDTVTARQGVRWGSEVKSGKDGGALDQTMPTPREWLRDLLENEATGAKYLTPADVVLHVDIEEASGRDPRSDLPPARWTV
jgi:hypothetical protein